MTNWPTAPAEIWRAFLDAEMRMVVTGQYIEVTTKTVDAVAKLRAIAPADCLVRRIDGQTYRVYQKPRPAVPK